MKINVKFERHSKGINYGVEVEVENLTPSDTVEIAEKAFLEAKATAEKLEAEMGV
jgi:hypothetical protein